MNVRGLAIGFVALVLAAIALAIALPKWRSYPEAQRSVGSTQLIANTVTQVMVRKIGASNLLAALGNRPLSWAAIESTNYVAYIQNLRDFGCPEETIRDIIIADIAKLYAKKRSALRTRYPPPPFWQTGEAWSQGAEANPELKAGLQQLETEQRALVRELLGIDMETEWSKFFEDKGGDDHRYSFLPAEKRAGLQGIVSKYDDLEQAIYQRTKGMMLEEDQAQLQQLQKARDAEIAQLLSPEEFRDYEVRNSPIADTLREQLAGFEPNEQEFRRLFELQKTYESQMAMPPGADEDVRSHIYDQAQTAMNNELRKILGDQRFNEYERAQDADYKTLVQFADRVQMPREIANQVYDIKTRAELQKEALEADPNINEQQRAAGLAALAERARREVNTAMGENASRYVPIGGHWLGDLRAGGPISAEVFPNNNVPQSPPQLPGFPPFPPFPPLLPFPVAPQR